VHSTALPSLRAGGSLGVVRESNKDFQDFSRSIARVAGQRLPF